MLYKISFFKLKVDSIDWERFFEKILKYHYSFELFIKKDGNKLEFFIKSNKNIAVLNNQLYPFSLFIDNETISEKMFLNRKTKIGFSFLNKALFELIEKTKIDNQDFDIIQIKINKLNPIKSPNTIKISYLNKVKRIVLIRTLSQFLAFDLSNSISVEIDKVKPRLVPLSQSLPLFDEGIIESYDFKDDKKFGVKSYDFFRHSLIVGQSGCGKSMLISLLIKNIWENFSDDYSIVLIDPHESIQNLIDKRIDNKIIDFEKQSTSLFTSSKSPILSTELTCDLFSTVIPIKENPGVLRLLKFSLVFLFENNMMNFDNLKKLLTDSLWRKENLKKTTNKSILDFFETEYQTIHTSQYSAVVLPILNLISEIDFIDSNIKTDELADLVNENFLTILPITKNKFGSRTAKIVGGAIIQQVFSLAQDKKFNKKVILIIDEMSIIQNPALTYILSEARKYGLTLILSQQYLYQVTPELLQSMTTNVINYFCFKVNRGDAEIISRNLNMEIEEYFLKNKNDPREEMELGTKIITELNPREIIVRIINRDKYCSPFKGRTVSVTNLN